MLQVEDIKVTAVKESLHGDGFSRADQNPARKNFLPEILTKVCRIV